MSVKGALVLSIVVMIALSSTSSLVRAEGSVKILFDQTYSTQFSVDQSFQSLANELSKAGYEVAGLTSAPITIEKLREADVFVIAARWTDFSLDEISSIKEFVRSGKGLLLTGVGWSYVDYQKQPIQKFPINVLGTEFSMTVNDDVIADPTNNEGDPGSPVFHTFTCHPITYGLSKVAPSPKMNPSSLTLSGSATAIITGDEDAYSTYHQKVYSKGTHPPVVAVNSYGSGRVVLLGHEAFLTGTDRSGGLYQYDNLKLALNIFAWLGQAAAVSCAATQSVTSAETYIETSTVTSVTVQTETMAANVLLGPLSVTDALLLVALVVSAPLSYVLGRRARRPVSVTELPRAGLFEVSVTVPSVGKTVSVEAGPDHTVGSLADTLMSTLELPKGKGCVLDYAGKLIGQQDFGKSLAALGIKEGSKLSLRVVE